MHRPILAVVMLAACFVLATGDSAFARHRRHAERAPAASIPVDASGTPIIMKGYRGAARRGSGSVLPSTPSAGLPDLPPRQLLQAPAVAPPPQAPPTFSDRVIGCIHSYPLNAGVGNNPTEQGAYVRQCAN